MVSFFESFYFEFFVNCFFFLTDLFSTQEEASSVFINILKTLQIIGNTTLGFEFLCSYWEMIDFDKFVEFLIFGLKFGSNSGMFVQRPREQKSIFKSKKNEGNRFLLSFAFVLKATVLSCGTSEVSPKS